MEHLKRQYQHKLIVGLNKSFLFSNVTMCVNMKLLQLLIQNDIKAKGTVVFHKAIYHMITTATF